MTQTKHTPGPWSLNGNGNIYSSFREWNFRIASLPIGPDCEAFGGAFIIVSQDELKANANLIAAAPDVLAEHQQWASIFGQALMAALQNDYSVIDRLCHDMKLEWKTDGTPRLESPAIAKATGAA